MSARSGEAPPRHLVVLGAGPKALALAAKARVLAEIGFSVPAITIIEAREVAHHWRGASGLTNGELPLGTPPDKDVGFPYHSYTWGDHANRKVNALMQGYSWLSYLVDVHRYGEWVDRGKPAPVHAEWAAYLEWVHRKLGRHVGLVQAEVREPLDAELPPLTARTRPLTGIGLPDRLHRGHPEERSQEGGPRDATARSGTGAPGRGGDGGC